ncbi:histone acetyltransferase [Caerostris extrusa]|uniref:histone acetyltransferase n=1 Tax=Caerostris extrusa TaxID=172846 RepID=A0AAV4NBL8_CAEEX|nr:histone acetyltransferase [Caerostris extrusa]
MQNSNLPVAQNAGEQKAVPSSGSAVNTATTVATAGAIANSAPSRTAVQEKTRLIQLQLAVMLHAYRCKINNNESSGESTPCSLPNCATMKHLLSHMKECKIGKQCTVPHCVSSSQIFAHWKYCTENDCPVCMPLKEAGIRRLQAASQTNQSNQKLAPADIRRSYAKLGLKVSALNDSLFMHVTVPARPLMSDQVVHSCSSQKLNHIPAFQPDQQDIQQSPLQMESMLQNNAVSFPNSKAPKKSRYHLPKPDNF